MTPRCLSACRNAKLVLLCLSEVSEVTGISPPAACAADAAAEVTSWLEFLGSRGACRAPMPSRRGSAGVTGTGAAFMRLLAAGPAAPLCHRKVSSNRVQHFALCEPQRRLKAHQRPIKRSPGVCQPPLTPSVLFFSSTVCPHSFTVLSL